MIETILYPSDNQFGIPALLPERQANGLITPCLAWGSIARRATMPGTWHFYVDDYRFNGLLKQPDTLLHTACVAAIEPNITIPPGLPLALALTRLYRKRWLARHWQQAGVSVWVDLHVAPELAAYNLLGVPPCWRAYATRGYNANVAEIAAEYELAAQHAGERPLFLVYGGGAAVQSLCLQRGWLWLNEQRNLVHEQQIPPQA